MRKSDARGAWERWGRTQTPHTSADSRSGVVRVCTCGVGVERACGNARVPRQCKCVEACLCTGRLMADGADRMFQEPSLLA